MSSFSPGDALPTKHLSGLPNQPSAKSSKPLPIAHGPSPQPTAAFTGTPAPVTLANSPAAPMPQYATTTPPNLLPPGGTRELPLPVKTQLPTDGFKASAIPDKIYEKMPRNPHRNRAKNSLRELHRSNAANSVLPRVVVYWISYEEPALPEIVSPVHLNSQTKRH